MTGTVIVFAGTASVVTWLTTLLIMSDRFSRRLAAREDELLEVAARKYEEGWNGHRIHLLRQMHDGARSHVPYDEGNPRPIHIRKGQIRVNRSGAS